MDNKIGSILKRVSDKGSSVLDINTKINQYAKDLSSELRKKGVKAKLESKGKSKSKVIYIENVNLEVDFDEKKCLPSDLMTIVELTESKYSIVDKRKKILIHSCLLFTSVSGLASLISEVVIGLKTEPKKSIKLQKKISQSLSRKFKDELRNKVRRELISKRLRKFLKIAVIILFWSIIIYSIIRYL